jgi:hypothetical protein
MSDKFRADVAPSFMGQTTSAISANTTINWTVIEDSHSMNSAGTLTIPAAGLYLVTFQAKQGATTVGFGLYVQKNGAKALYAPGAPATNFSGASITGLLRCVASDTLAFRSDTAFTPVNDLPAFSTYAHVVRVRA